MDSSHSEFESEGSYFRILAYWSHHIALEIPIF